MTSITVQWCWGHATLNHENKATSSRLKSNQLIIIYNDISKPKNGAQMNRMSLPPLLTHQPSEIYGSILRTHLEVMSSRCLVGDPAYWRLRAISLSSVPSGRGIHLPVWDTCTLGAWSEFPPWRLSTGSGAVAPMRHLERTSRHNLHAREWVSDPSRCLAVQECGTYTIRKIAPSICLLYQ